MNRKFIEKVKNIIQWTKQFHFFHIWLGLGFALALLPISCLILTLLFSIFESSELSELGRAVGIGFMLDIAFIILSYISSFILALIIEFIIYFLFKCSIKKTFNVQSPFLLSNKFYNLIYKISIFIAIVIGGFLLIVIMSE